MFGLGWSELLIVGIVALIVIGPKDLPGMFRTMGQFTGKMRGMAREFSRAMDEAADQAGVKDVQNTLQAAANPRKYGLDKVQEATSSAFKPGSSTEALSKERQEAKDKILAKSAEVAQKRIDAEKAAEAAKAKEAAAPKPDNPDPDA